MPLIHPGVIQTYINYGRVIEGINLIDSGPPIDAVQHGGEPVGVVIERIVL